MSIANGNSDTLIQDDVCKGYVLVNGHETSGKEQDNHVNAVLEKNRTAVAQAPPPIIEGVGFQMFGGMLIIGNALVIGMETDLAAWEYWDIVENVFLGLFCLELLIKMCSLGPRVFFCEHPDVPWHLFDFFIVGLGVFDLLMSYLTGSEGAGSFATIFRIIRLLRILRIFRIVKFLKQLYVLAFGLVEAVKAVFWVTVLMVFVLYICSVVLVKTMGRPEKDDPHRDFMSYRFGHILDSMLNLFILVSSPNLPTYQDEKGVLEEHPVLALFLCAFIIFGSFGIVALLTGVISESMFEKNEVRKDQIRQEHEEMRQTLGSRAEALFMSLGELDANGEAPVETVRSLSGQMWAMLEAAGAEITRDDVISIIDFMDVNGTGLVGKTEFRATIEKIAEGLSTMGMQEIANKVGICETKIDQILGSMEALDMRTAVLEQSMQLLLENARSNVSIFC